MSVLPLFLQGRGDQPILRIDAVILTLGALGGVFGLGFGIVMIFHGIEHARGKLVWAAGGDPQHLRLGEPRVQQ